MSGFGQDDYEMRRNDGINWRNVLLPVMGFLLLGSGAAIAFALSAPATEFLQSRVDLPQDTDGLQIVIGVGIFLIVLLVFATFYALFAPKPDKIISENELAKEKKAREREVIAQRKRRREINMNMARERRERENR